MSTSAVRNLRPLSTLVAHRRAADAARDEIETYYLWGSYSLDYWELNQDDVDSLFGRGQRYKHDELMTRLLLQGKSPGARYIAARINSGAAPDLKQLAQDWWCHRAIKRELSADELREIKAAASDLRVLGIKTQRQARRFYRLYRRVMVADRPWGSCYQPDQAKVLALANLPNYNKLPLWVKKGLIDYGPCLHKTGRIGNIWRLPDCVRAWRWCPTLPKGIAEKVGRMGVKGRVTAALAWNEVGHEVTLQDWSNRSWKRQSEDVASRAELVDCFWVKFRQLERSSLLEIFSLIIDRWPSESGTIRCIAEGWLGLPHESLKAEWPIDNYDYRGMVMVIARTQKKCLAIAIEPPVPAETETWLV